jgi:hypothetical protein
MIQTAQDYNERLAYCGCCQIPLCPEPAVVCQSMTLTLSVPWGFYDPDDVPPGDFDLALWKVHKAKTTENTATLSVDVDTTDGMGGGTHTVGTGSMTVTIEEAYDEVWNKSGCSSFAAALSTTYAGDGGFSVAVAREFFCGGVWTKKDWTLNEYAYTYVGGVPADLWRLDYDFTGYSYTCDGGVLVPNAPSTSSSTEFWTWPSVFTTSIAAVHPARVITIPATTTYLDAVTWADVEAEMRDWIDTNTAAGCWTSGLCRAKMIATLPTGYLGGGTPGITTHPLRFRFRIPSTHTGSYFKITYDIAEFPEDGDPSFVSEDNVVEWTGPGTGASTHPSWLTPWVEIDPPEVPGERRVVNIRYTCRHGVKFPALPQVMGEALEIPPP